MTCKPLSETQKKRLQKLFVTSYDEAKKTCHVRAGIKRLGKPSIIYAKNHPIPFDERVPYKDQIQDDWVEHDPHSY